MWKEAARLVIENIAYVLSYDFILFQNAFAVGATNGAITIKRSLDRETIETATLVIKVQDMNAPPGSSQSATGMHNVTLQTLVRCLVYLFMCPHNLILGLRVQNQS